MIGMEIPGESVDDILLQLYEKLPNYPVTGSGTRGKIEAEMLAVSLVMTNPRMRISRSENRGKPFSALGELLWYLAGSDRLEFIERYIDDYRKDAVDGALPGAYGPRLFAMRGAVDQLSNVASLLQKTPETKRAVVQLFDAEDIVTRKSEVPCTTTLQFLIRDARLHLFATMRSNDAYLGLPHDIFCFTMLQEIMARRVGVEIGHYHHYASTLHVYKGKLQMLAAYVAEGHQRAIAMPPMPVGDPQPAIEQLLNAELTLRRGESITASEAASCPYWADLIRLLQVFWNRDHIDKVLAELHDPGYKIYVDGRRRLPAITAE